MCSSDVDFLSKGSFTYLSNSNACSSSWLDHESSSNCVEISKIGIMYEISLCDHIPLYFELEFHGVQRQELHAVTETNHTEYFWIPLAKMSMY